MSDQAVGNYLTEAIVPAVTHEDPRYCTLGHGGFFKRSGYAVSRLLITRTDGGSRTFNFAEIVGNGAGAGISDTYYPARESTLTKTGQKWVTQVALDGVFNILKEFWPNINHAVFPKLCLHRGPDGCAPRGTSRQRNAHNIESREVHYPWHPWHARTVAVHEAFTRNGRAMCWCGADENPGSRLLGIPQWMFDSMACRRVPLASAPMVSCGALLDLKALLRRASFPVSAVVLQGQLFGTR